MSTRFCPTCATEVEDADGFCLLGHSLKVSSITESMDELRTEVDHYFSAARAELASMNGRGSVATGTPETAHRPPAPPAPAGRPAPGPSAPPPPPSRDSESTLPTVWQAFEHELASSEGLDSGDPISIFAPAPRMDWGPERPALLRRPTLRRPSGASA